MKAKGEIIKAVIIDHNSDLNYTSSLLLKFCPDIRIVGEAVNVEEGILLIEQIRPQLVFLDTCLSEGCGFDILEYFSTFSTDHFEFRTIVTTDNDSYALKAIKMNVTDYLIKPLIPSEVKAAVKRFKRQRNSVMQTTKMSAILYKLSVHIRKRKKIALKTADRIIVYNLDEIIWCESHDNYTMFHLYDHTQILVSKTLKEFDLLLSENSFERIHQSYLINLNHLKSYEKKAGGFVVMIDGSTLPVAIRKRERLISLLKSL